jgi:hypothetical protein
MDFGGLDIKKLLTYYVAIIIVAGTIKLKLFYGSFKLEILNYLDTSEILLAFMGDLIYYISIVFIMELFEFLIYSQKEIQARIDNQTYVIDENIFKKRFIKFLKFYKVLGYLILFNIVLLIVSIIIKIDYSFTSIFLFILAMYFFFGFVSLEYRRKYFIMYGTKPKSAHTNVVLLGIIIISGIIIFNHNDVTSIKSYKKYYGSTFIASGDTIRSDSTAYYIGKTNNFVFYYKEKTKSCVVFPIKDITQLEIKTYANRK